MGSAVRIHVLLQTVSVRTFCRWIRVLFWRDLVSSVTKEINVASYRHVFNADEFSQIVDLIDDMFDAYWLAIANHETDKANTH